MGSGNIGQHTRATVVQVGVDDDMAAYDRLPPMVREALRNAPYRVSASTVEPHIKAGMHPAAVVAALRAQMQRLTTQYQQERRLNA